METEYYYLNGDILNNNNNIGFFPAIYSSIHKKLQINNYNNYYSKFVAFIIHL